MLSATAAALISVLAASAPGRLLGAAAQTEIAGVTGLVETPFGGT